MHRLTICLGGFNLKVCARDQFEKQNLAQAYRNFLSQNKNGDYVHIKSNNFMPPISTKSASFSLGNNWGVFKQKNNYCFELKEKEKGSTYISSLAIFKHNFLSADMYVSRIGSNNSHNCLAFPIDQMFFAHLLSLHKGALVHGCGINFKENGLLFMGVSGSGKSTIGNIFLRNTKAQILNDDRIIIRKEGKEFFIYGTPWHGSIPICSAGKAGLKAIFFLKHSSSHKLKKLSANESLPLLTSLSFLSYFEKKFAVNSLSTLIRLAQKVACYELAFAPDNTVIDLIKHACF